METRIIGSFPGHRAYLLLQIILLIMVINPTFGQTFTTPETFSHKKEVFRPVSYYTGQVDVSIPLLGIKTNEMSIPVVLKYIGGEGLRAINPYGNVGFGWKLSAGGVITRTVNGLPDETIYSSNSKGFFLRDPNNGIKNETVRNNAYLFLDNYFKADSVEYSPDIFSFNFLGYSGYFVMGYDGIFRIQSQDIVNAEVFTTSFPTIGNVIYFKLTSNDGTVFTFGSKEGSIELSGGGSLQPFQLNAWYLTRIDFTNGRFIDFNYEPNKDIHLHYLPSVCGGGGRLTVSPVVPANIIFPGGKAIFFSDLKPHSICNCIDDLRIINKIELQTPSNQKIIQVNLKYSTKNWDRYYFLDSLKINERRYSFKYNTNGSLPDYSEACGTDYWGFYNGQPELTGCIPATYRDIYLNQYLVHPRKMPSETHSKLGILTSITYPTGDEELFEYEAHNYSYCGLQTLGGYYHSYSKEPKIAGGLRIAKITLGDQVRKYKYVNFFDPDDPDYIPGSMSSTDFSSSGILYKYPSVCYMTAEALNFLSIEGEPPITYHRVIEFLSDKSYTIYDMNSTRNRPDGENNQNPDYYACQVSNPAIYTNISKTAFIGALGKNSSCALERGQIKKISIHDSANNLKRTVTNTYSSDPDRYNQYVASVYITGTAEQRMVWLGDELGNQYLNGSSLIFALLHSYCIYTFPVYLEKEEITDYYGNQSITRTNRYSYNSNKLRSSITTYDSRGDSLKTIFRYPSDINTGVYSAMINKNMLNYPIEIINMKNNKYTGSKLVTYKASGTTYVPDKEYSLEITTPLSSFNYFNGSVRDNNYKDPDISYDSYSDAGNLRQLTGRNNLPVSYLWDVSDIYPLAQVKGASYSQIGSLEGKTNDYSNSDLWTGLSNLVPSSQFSTYSYKSLTGISSVTNPGGVNTYYTYDVAGRLFLERDDDKNIISRNRYAYRNYPDDGSGGYKALGGQISVSPFVTKGISSRSSANITGGSGSLNYNWYLKNSTGTVISSLLNSDSDKFDFTCNQTGTFYICCEITDNMLGTYITRNSSSFISCVSICDFAMNVGFSFLGGYVINMGTNVSLDLTFNSSYAMQPNVNYHVTTISTGCRPAGTKYFNIDVIMGRSFEITIDRYGYVYFRMTRGETMPAYYSVSTGILTY